MNTKIDSVFQKNTIGLGKRKQAIARVFLVPGEGNIVINKVSGEKYLQYNLTYLKDIWAPLKELNLEKQFDIIALVRGGGLTGQTESIQLGVARLLCQMNPQNRSVLKPFGFLTRDARIKERKKIRFTKSKKSTTILKTLKNLEICQNLKFILHGLMRLQSFVMENLFVILVLQKVNYKLIYG
jgi:small subunit ribosomal protein S9